MAEIVQLDDLVPEDIVFVYREEEYVVPGDLDTETTLRVFKYLRNLVTLRDSREQGDIPAEADVVKAASALQELLLSIFQIRNPSLTSIPFGAKSLPIVTERILGLLGISTAAEDLVEEGAPVPTGRASRSPKKSSPVSASKRTPPARS